MRVTNDANSQVLLWYEEDKRPVLNNDIIQFEVITLPNFQQQVTIYNRTVPGCSCRHLILFPSLSIFNLRFGDVILSASYKHHIYTVLQLSISCFINLKINCYLKSYKNLMCNVERVCKGITHSVISIKKLN